jgi:MFS family permease
VIAAFGSGWAILSNAVTYGAFIAALGLIDGKLLQVSQRPPRAKRQIREGVSYVFGNPEILLVMCVAFFVGTFGMNFQMTSALMAQQEFHKGAQEYGILGTIMAVGSLTGALLAARRREAPRGRFIVKMAVLYGFILIITGLMPSYLTYALILPITGFVALLTMTASNAAIQLNVAPHLRGRVMALYAMVMMGGTPIGAPILGWLGELFGPRWTLLAGGGLTVLGVLISALVLARRQQMHIVPVLTPRPHFELRDR